MEPLLDISDMFWYWDGGFKSKLFFEPLFESSGFLFFLGKLQNTCIENSLIDIIVVEYPACSDTVSVVIGFV